MEPIIKVEHLSKKYLLNHASAKRYITLRDQISNSVKSIFSSASTKESNHAKSTETFLALNDVNFEVFPGDKIGIIGRNGAGKSTLLKILSRIIEPSSGEITLNGRIASLLEVGTGFHPELTGRENIYLNGAILGMSKTEITEKFDEIVAFSEVERFLDTPVKRYSSGMYVRLAFAVAAHLEPEILVVDEVLSVGDLEFQKKCLGKMQEISGQGRTVLFVSHNMEAVQKLCEKGILLSNGTVKHFGPIGEVAQKYLEVGDKSEMSALFPVEPTNSSGDPVSLQVESRDNIPLPFIQAGQGFQVRIKFNTYRKIEHFIIAIGIRSASYVPVRTCYAAPMTIEKGSHEALFIFDDIILSAGYFPITIGLSSYENSFYYKEAVAALEISEFTEFLNDPRIIRKSEVGFILNPIEVIIKSF